MRTKREAVEQHLESSLRSGAFPPGSRLPSSIELAAALGVSPETVQSALMRLTRRGLVSRIRGIGTFASVSAGRKPLALVYGAVGDPNRSFFLVLLAHLAMRASAHDWGVRHYLVLGGEDDPAFVALRHDVADGKIGAVVEFTAPHVVRKWVRTACSTPFSRMPLGVDDVDLLRKGISCIEADGRKRIAVIGERACALESLARRQLAAAGGCRFIVVADDQESVYAAITDLMNESNPPDGILFLSDVGARGGLLALMIMGVSVPDKVSVVTHSNKGVPLFFPGGATRLEVDPGEMADRVIGEMLLSVVGKKADLSPCQVVVVPGATCLHAWRPNVD